MVRMLQVSWGLAMCGDNAALMSVVKSPDVATSSSANRGRFWVCRAQEGMAPVRRR
jgi:hypothetical protein